MLKSCVSHELVGLAWKARVGAIQEVCACYPCALGAGPQIATDDGQAGGERSLVHQCEQVDARTCEEYLNSSIGDML